jgi:putative transposase
VATMRDTMKGIEERYDLTIEQFGDDKDHVHLLVSFHPKYSIGQIVRLFKSITAKRVFSEHPVLKRDLWGGEFWTDGNWNVVENYVKNQGYNLNDRQLTIWQ